MEHHDGGVIGLPPGGCRHLQGDPVTVRQCHEARGGGRLPRKTQFRGNNGLEVGIDEQRAESLDQIDGLRGTDLHGVT
jgi:hypothetical protein